MERTATLPRRSAEIFSAAVSLLAEQGYQGVSVEAIASRAGVHKTTIYRTWATKDEVLAAALRDGPEFALTIPDTGSLRGDLQALADQLQGLLSQPRTRRVIAAMLAVLPEHPGTAQAARSFFADRLARETVIFERAAGRGEIDAGTDPELIMNLLGGALWFRTLLRGDPATTADRDELVDAILRSLG